MTLVTRRRAVAISRVLRVWFGGQEWLGEGKSQGHMVTLGAWGLAVTFGGCGHQS
ncbi:hypothetical protein [Halomonas sp. WWR20]